MAFEEIGSGLSCSTKNEVTGQAKYIKDVNDVIELIQGEAEGKICLVEQAGTTTLGPILSRITGVICSSGSTGSHLAIVSREFEIPAFMACNLKMTFKEMDGKKIKMRTEADDETGIVLVWND
ncbi:MAG: PEP-utilizing enzyme [Candidatus Helarchaeota archaeon]